MSDDVKVVKKKKPSNFRRFGFFILIILIIAGMVAMSNQLIETNRAGYYQIKQAAITGSLSVRNDPGVYPQLFGEIFTYSVTGMNYFSSSSLDGGSGSETDPIKVRFNDGGTAEISGSIKFKLSRKYDNQIALHEDYKSFGAVQSELVRQVVTEALMQSASLMNAEEIYSSRRSEFTSLAEQQIKLGIFETVSNEEKTLDAEGNEFINRITAVKYDDNGVPVIRKKSPFAIYEIEIVQFVIKDIDFDDTIDKLISKKKEAEQEKNVAKANAERAKQDAITAQEKGKAAIAEAEAEELVEKVRATTRAQKEKEVAELKAEQDLKVAQLNEQKAKAEANAVLLKKRADAQGNELLVRAGITPSEKAQIEKETAIGVAEALSKWQPSGVVVSGGAGGEAMNPLTAMGLNAMVELTEKLSKQNLEE